MAPTCASSTSPLDALGLARKHSDREVVFFGLGFETTMPSTALTILQAEAEGIGNFSVFCNHITIVPTLEALLRDPEISIDGFIGPGHVSMVIGTEPYGFIAQRYRKPFVVSGFEPLDILQALWMVLRQIQGGRAEIENQYTRVVADHGNDQALAAVERVYELRDFFEWRGLGSIDHSGVRIRATYARFDAERKFDLPDLLVADPEACQCGEVLKGLIKPWQCRVFGTGCTPESPMGALMVSAEGACAATTSTAAPNARRPVGHEPSGGTAQDHPCPCSGGKAMRDLIEDVFVGAFANPLLAPLEDQARINLAELAGHGDRLAFTTDSFVVDPLLFPGGDIGRLAVCGYGQRSRGERRAPALSDLLDDHGGGSVARSATAHHGFDAEGGGRSRGGDRDRRHQGRAQGGGRQAVRQQRRDRRHSGTTSRPPRPISVPAIASWSAPHSATTASRSSQHAASWTSRPTWLRTAGRFTAWSRRCSSSARRSAPCGT